MLQCYFTTSVAAEEIQAGDVIMAGDGRKVCVIQVDKCPYENTNDETVMCKKGCMVQPLLLY